MLFQGEWAAQGQFIISDQSRSEFDSQQKRINMRNLLTAQLAQRLWDPWGKSWEVPDNLHGIQSGNVKHISTWTLSSKPYF